MAKRLIIDNLDFSSYFPRAGYQVEYTSVDGGQGGVMLNGESLADELAVKATVVLPCMPLNETQLSTLLTVIYASLYHSVEYYDPRTGRNRTITATARAASQTYRGFGANAVEYWTGIVVTLTEK